MNIPKLLPLSIFLIMSSCIKEEPGVVNKDNGILTIDVTASMPESPEIESGSRTEVDKITPNSISLKWSEKDTLAFGLTIYKPKDSQEFVMGIPSFPATPSSDGSSLDFTAAFNNPKRAYMVYPKINKKYTYTISKVQSRTTFSSNNIMLTEFDFASLKSDITYNHEISMLKIRIHKNDKDKAVESVSLYSKAQVTDGEDDTVLNNVLQFSVSDDGNLLKTYTRTDGCWVYNLDDEERESGEFVMCILPTKGHKSAVEVWFKVKYTDDTELYYSLDEETGGNFLNSFNNLEAGKAISIELPGNKPQANPYFSTPYNSEVFLKGKLSCEFDSGFDTGLWENPMDDKFATWTFLPENVETGDGKLKLKIMYDEHIRKDKKLYFTSGMLRSRTKVGYGYYEARIKGADVWPGTCSAFWLYTFPNEIDASNGSKNDVIYNEIDVIELQQVANNKRMLSQNMHIWILDENLEKVQIKAGKYPKLGKNETLVGWNPEDDYHIYAVENRPDSVVFYVDNVRVASKPNLFWHMDMYLTLSLGLRKPFEVYDEWGVRTSVDPDGLDRAGLDTVGEFVDPDSPEKFTSVMYVDYVRSWKRDYSMFESGKRGFTDEDKINFQ